MNKINMENVTHYSSSLEGKKLFVEKVLAPLLKQANTGWDWGCTYEYYPDTGTEKVYFLNRHKERITPGVDVTADSLEAIVRDVFNRL